MARVRRVGARVDSGGEPLLGRKVVEEFQRHEPWPQRVLITNDKGLSDLKIVALARANLDGNQTVPSAGGNGRSRGAGGSGRG